MKKLFAKKERGQSVVLFALLLVVLIAMLALVLDGGFAFANRRAAQNAADAGALAGAAVLCEGGTAAEAEARAIHYATVRNQADPDTCTAVADVAAKRITVNTSIAHDSFFAQIIGHDVITSTATASAGCKNPCTATAVLPVAWSCKPPVGGGTPDDPLNPICSYGFGPEHTYIIMDSDKLDPRNPDKRQDFICQEPPNTPGSPIPDAIDCDLTNDGINDLHVGGSRSWLDLNGGGGGGGEMKDWIRNGYPYPLNAHTWRPAETGNITAVYKEIAKYRVGDDVLIPIFDNFCDEYPEGSVKCADFWHDKPPDAYQDTVIAGSSNQYFHVVHFAWFHVTCVQEGNKVTSENGTPAPANCPGRQQIIDANPALGQEMHNMNSVEGYFRELGYEPELSGNCGDATGSGAYTIYLDE